MTNARTRRETYMLLPLPEARLFRFDLLSEALAKGLFLFLELGVIELLDLGFAKLAGLHLLLTVVLVVKLLSCGDEVEHVRADEQRTQLAEVAVVLVLNCVVTPISRAAGKA